MRRGLIRLRQRKFKICKSVELSYNTVHVSNNKVQDVHSLVPKSVDFYYAFVYFKEWFSLRIIERFLSLVVFITNPLFLSVPMWRWKEIVMFFLDSETDSFCNRIC